MTRAQKKELRQRQTTRQLMGIRQLTEHGAKTAGGELVFFMVRPDNLSVLSGEGIRGRVKRLTDLLCAAQEVRLLALDSRESFRRNKDWYRQRLEQEELPAIRELLRRDAAHLDEIQASTASAREFALVYRLGPREPEADPGRLRQTEQALGDLGFRARLASEQDVKRLLAVYYQQDVTTEWFEDFDGERWVTEDG
ncbi:MAG TPA: hypothetical protein IAA56_08080 [Candidatus Galloscillospira excrementavium]|nr:hypothetical protein [Candidatus Galloscillospira excrementavium]